MPFKVVIKPQAVNQSTVQAQGPPGIDLAVVSQRTKLLRGAMLTLLQRLIMEEKAERGIGDQASFREVFAGRLRLATALTARGYG